MLCCGVVMVKKKIDALKKKVILSKSKVVSVPKSMIINYFYSGYSYSILYNLTVVNI